MSQQCNLLPLLTYIAEIHDPYSNDHASRVLSLCVLLAKSFGWEDESQDLNDLKTSAALHDIGKVELPDTIRRSPNKYTTSEREIMRLHPGFGYRLLSTLVNGGLPTAVKLDVLHHHEDWNGQGYPNGLKGTDIPIGSRIIRICDTYDALTHNRGYAPAVPHNKAVDIMTAEQIKNMWADPSLFQLFLLQDWRMK